MRSIFGKYLVAFTVILFVCISAILLVVTSKTSHESYDLRCDKMRVSAESVKLFVEEHLEDNSYESLYESFGRDGALQRIIDEKNDFEFIEKFNNWFNKVRDKYILDNTP